MHLIVLAAHTLGNTWSAVVNGGGLSAVLGNTWS